MKDHNGLQKAMYADLKATFALSAQPVVRAVKKVVDAYATRNTNLGRATWAHPPRSGTASASPAAPTGVAPQSRPRER
ncbi:hypothetical protein [Streptomyces sp. CA-106131]|uniref:hypothetical protein n=1 Tax=Streptomyces sp. CA-106131 TaxID=3240045 RepID=UPI003D8E36F8